MNAGVVLRQIMPEPEQLELPPQRQALAVRAALALGASFDEARLPDAQEAEYTPEGWIALDSAIGTLWCRLVAQDGLAVARPATPARLLTDLTALEPVLLALERALAVQLNPLPGQPALGDGVRLQLIKSAIMADVLLPLACVPALALPADALAQDVAGAFAAVSGNMLCDVALAFPALSDADAAGLAPGDMILWPESRAAVPVICSVDQVRWAMTLNLAQASLTSPGPVRDHAAAWQLAFAGVAMSADVLAGRALDGDFDIARPGQLLHHGVCRAVVCVLPFGDAFCLMVMSAHS